MQINTGLASVSFLLIALINPSVAIKCYECSSKSGGRDQCDAYKYFDKTNHIAVECNSDESHTPGTFCMKYVEQSPIGFIWEGRWRQVIRRCASVAESGVTGVCNWGVHLNGVYWEECYCSEDGCNSAFTSNSSKALIIFTCGLLWLFRWQ